MITIRHPRRPLGTPRVASRRGTAAIEFVVILPLIVSLLVGLWEVGRLIEISQIMNNAAREGAHYAASGQPTIGQVQQVVINYLKAAGVPVTNPDPNAVVQVKNLGFPGNPTPPDNNPQNATQLDQLQVSVTIPFNDVRWIGLNLVTNASTMLNGQAVWCCIKDVPYPSVDYPPPD